MTAKDPKKRRRKEKAIPYLQEGWKVVGRVLSDPDGIGIYEGGRGIVYAHKVKDRYVLFAVDVEKRVIDTAFTKRKLEDTKSYIFIYKRGG